MYCYLLSQESAYLFCMKPTVSIVWFKRDLRVHDHLPLFEAAQSGVPVLPLYVVEPDYWSQPFASRRQWHFIRDCLLELREDCAKLGQPLIVRAGEVTQVLDALRADYTIQTIFAHEETGNGWTYERDKAVIAYCAKSGIPLIEYPCNGVVRRLGNRDDWSRIRNQRMALDPTPKPQALLALENIPLGDIPSKEDATFGAAVPGIVQEGGRRAAVQTLKSFLQERSREYIYRLSAPGPSERYCSRLSTHLAWGTVSVREVVKATQKRRAELTSEQSGSYKRNLTAFGSRLSWRCHFIQKIEDQPSIEHACMHPAFEGMREGEHNDAFYTAWVEGKTGYPLIDACMRNLTHEGWITFRMRAMLVSFASYHLWLDWRKTGYHLAQLFTDYEPGIHYSQLQMQSGVTGINAVRMYNPIKQSQEHDPHGAYIRRWVPELKHVSDDWIHEPWKMDMSLQEKSKCVLGVEYPHPIVEHGEAIKAARQKISAARKEAGFREDAKKVFQKLGSRKRPRKSKKPAKQEDQLALPLG